MKAEKIKKTTIRILKAVKKGSIKKAHKIEKDLMKEQVLTQYYFMKALKEVDDDRKVYFQFANLTSKIIFRNILDNMYNFDDAKELAAVRDGLGAIEKYEAVIRHTLKKDIEGLL